MDRQIEGVYSFSVINCHAMLTAPSLLLFFLCTLAPLLLLLFIDPSLWRRLHKTGLVTEETAVHSEVRNSQLLCCSCIVKSFQHGETRDEMGLQFGTCSMLNSSYLAYTTTRHVLIDRITCDQQISINAPIQRSP